jgi:hypothetical protein
VQSWYAMTQVDVLVGQLMRPTFVLNMARPAESHGRDGTAHQRSGHTRAENARKAIDALVRRYVEENPPYE